MWRVFTILPAVLILVNLVVWFLNRGNAKEKFTLRVLLGFPVLYIVLLYFFSSGDMGTHSNLPMFFVYTGSMVINLGYLVYALGRFSRAKN